MLKVKDLMTKEVITIDLKANTMDTAKLMKEKRIASLVVTKGKTPLGIVTERDLGIYAQRIYRVRVQG